MYQYHDGQLKLVVVWPEQILCQPIADKHETSTPFNSTKEEREEKEERLLRQQCHRPRYAERKSNIQGVHEALLKVLTGGSMK